MCSSVLTLWPAGTVLALGWIICSCFGLAAEPPAGEIDFPRGERDRVADRNLVRTGEQTHRPDREFVRAWKIKDLRHDLHRMGAGRSFKNGKELFSAASCDQCHRLNRVGGTLGPDLTGVAKRNSRAVILREIIDPSKQMSDKYQTHQIINSTGKVHQGLVVRQDTKFVYLASDPSKPAQLLKIPLDEIEEKTPSTISIMPEDLLNTLTKEEILDLLAYIESGGREDHSAFNPVGEER